MKGIVAALVTIAAVVAIIISTTVSLYLNPAGDCCYQITNDGSILFRFDDRGEPVLFKNRGDMYWAEFGAASSNTTIVSEEETEE